MPDQEKRKTLLRQWEMLKLLPKTPEPQVTVKHLREGLAAAGFDVDERTIQRDLKALADIFPIDVQDRSPPFGWRWNRHAHFDIPSMPLAEAMALELVEQYLQPLLPLSQLEVLQGLFRAAHRRLDTAGDSSRLNGWLDRVRVVQPAQPLLPPPIDPEVQHVIYEALLKRRVVSVDYRNAGGSLTQGMPLHLLGLVQRGPLTFLVAKAWNYSDVRLFVLHRFEAAVLLDDQTVEPEDFNLDEYLASGALEFSAAGKTIRIDLRLTTAQAKYLLETPLSPDQIISPDLDEGWCRLEATVNDTAQLRWWLRGLGANCEVIGPEELRQEFVEQLLGLSALYT